MIKKWADRFLKWYCHPDYYPDIKGDLEEEYQENVELNIKNAELEYALGVLQLFRPTLMRSFFSQRLINSNGMLRNYFKTSVRNLVKQRLYATINVVGLAVGLAAFLLISEYINFEKSYDRFFTDSEQLYRLTTDQIKDEVIGTRDAMSFNPSGRALMEELPEVLDYTCTYQFGEIVFRQNDRVDYEKKVIAADSNYFRLFDYQFIEGDPLTALDEPNSLVLTESKAKKYFGENSPIGRELELLGSFNRPFKVTGVIEDVPENTHYKFDIMMSIKSIQDRLDNDRWGGFNYYTFLKIDPRADMEALRNQMPDLAKKYINEETSLVFNLQPLESIHLYSDFTFEPEIHGSAKAVSFLVIISIFVLVIAWVNYVNLSTARAVDRAKEVGLRKVIGAYRRQLIFQFLIESLIVNFIGALLAIAIVELALPYFNALIEKQIAVHLWNQPRFLITVLTFFVAGTLVSGFYPALVLSGFRPVAVLKGKFRNSKQGVLLRKGLVTVQFAVSLTLIAGTLIVGQQVQYMRSKDPGFDVNNVIAFSSPRAPRDQREEVAEKMRQFRSQLLSHHSVVAAGGTSNLPGGDSGDINSSSGGVTIVGKTDRLDATTYMQWNNDNFIETMRMDLIAGRDFDRGLAEDTASVIVNESFLRRFGFTDMQSMINERVRFGRNPENDSYRIIGVINDFNRTSLKTQVEPTCYFHSETFGNSNTVVRLSNENANEGVEFVERIWANFFPDTPLDIIFLDDRFERLYKEDKRFGSVFGSFSVLAILVAILGLFGLSSFMAIQRTKEVGVRKVLGASVGNIIGLFYKDFLVLMGFSSLVGFPAVYFVMNSWLDNYAYRIDFPWWLLLVAIGIISVFSLITVGYQTSKVAALDPAKTLKYE